MYIEMYKTRTIKKKNMDIIFVVNKVPKKKQEILTEMIGEKERRENFITWKEIKMVKDKTEKKMKRHNKRSRRRTEAEQSSLKLMKAHLSKTNDSVGESSSRSSPNNPKTTALLKMK
jgi:hypothetical protein